MEPKLLDIPMTLGTFRHFAGWADKITGAVIPTPGYFGRATHSYTRREAIGVVAAIVPWNAPAMILSWKLAPALACGNTIVVKPSEDAMLAINHLGALVQEAGYYKRRWRYRDTHVRAPLTAVDDVDGDTWVRAPFARVYSGRRGTWVRPPFVNLWIPR